MSLGGGWPPSRCRHQHRRFARACAALSTAACAVMLVVFPCRWAAGDVTNDSVPPPLTSVGNDSSREPPTDLLEGFLEPYRTVDLAAGEPGVLVELRVREGTTVRAGDLIGRLDTLVLERTLSIARHRADSEGAQRSAEAERGMARRTVEQLRLLQQRGNATASEVERAETDLAIAESRVALALDERQQQRLECERIEAQIERRKLVSPLDGVIAEVYCEEGEAFPANDPRVVTIVQVDRLRVQFHVPPRVARDLRAGQPARVQFPELERHQTGTVEKISPVIDARSGTRTVAVLLENPGGILTSGLRCQVDFSQTVSETRRPHAGRSAGVGGLRAETGPTGFEGVGARPLPASR